LKDDIPMEYLSHKERYEHAIRKSCIMFKKVNEWQQKDESGSNSMKVFKYAYLVKIYIIYFNQ